MGAMEAEIRHNNRKVCFWNQPNSPTCSRTSSTVGMAGWCPHQCSQTCSRLPPGLHTASHLKSLGLRWFEIKLLSKHDISGRHPTRNNLLPCDTSVRARAGSTPGLPQALFALLGREPGLSAGRREQANRLEHPLSLRIF